MKGIRTKMLLGILLILCIVGIYFLLGENTEAQPAEQETNIAKIIENLEESEVQGESRIYTIFARISNENKLHYSISDEDDVKEEFRQLDLSADTYHSEAEEIMENTNPKVLLQYMENQCEKAVSALSDLENQEVSYTWEEKDEEGNTDIVKIYDLGDGTEIVLQETDCADSSSKDSRSYTVSYAVVVGGTMQGKFSVTNHYIIDENQITLKSAKVKEYGGNGPLTVELRDKPWQSSLKTASKTGDEIYAGAAFYLTSSKDAVIGNKGSDVSWNENSTRLHKIYGAVKVKDTKDGHISAETYSRLRTLK